MSAGLAKQIRNQYPVVYDAYKKWCDNAENSVSLLGCAQFVPIGSQVFVNCFGQDGYGRDKVYTFYPALAKSLQEVYIKFLGSNKTIAIPFGIGCGLAGGDWDTVLETIEFVFESYDGEIQIWKLC